MVLQTSLSQRSLHLPGPFVVKDPIILHFAEKAKFFQFFEKFNNTSLFLSANSLGEDIQNYENLNRLAAQFFSVPFPLILCSSQLPTLP